MTTLRLAARWLHLAMSIPIIGYLYSPFERLPGYAPATRPVFFPVLALTGLWMWKGPVLLRLIRRTRTGQERPA